MVNESCDFTTIGRPGEASIREKMSKFIGFARHASDAAEAKAIVSLITNEYHDARHVCWAYMVGADRTEFLSSDNGEPSGTAGKPILGQINSAGLTDCVVVVVRYFGGIKLGTSGLIAAYREAARLAIADAEIFHDFVKADVTVTFAYEQMNDVMKVAKKSGGLIKGQTFDNICTLTLTVRSDEAEQLRRRFADLEITTD